jgi:ethanolamine utilization protein EutP (predicted NTPase)
MKKLAALMLVVARLFVAVVAISGVATAEETKIVGVITKIDLAGKDAKTATVTLEDTKTQQPVDITIEDDLTLDKLKDHRITDGDEIRCKYEVKDGKNVSTYFRKTAGC